MQLTACHIPQTGNVSDPSGPLSRYNTAASENQIHTFGNSFKIDLKLAAGDADRNFVIKYLSARTL